MNDIKTICDNFVKEYRAGNYALADRYANMLQHLYPVSYSRWMMSVGSLMTPHAFFQCYFDDNNIEE